MKSKAKAPASLETNGPRFALKKTAGHVEVAPKSIRPKSKADVGDSFVERISDTTGSGFQGFHGFHGLSSLCQAEVDQTSDFESETEWIGTLEF